MRGNPHGWRVRMVFRHVRVHRRAVGRHAGASDKADGAEQARQAVHQPLSARAAAPEASGERAWRNVCRWRHGGRVPEERPLFVGAVLTTAPLEPAVFCVVPVASRTAF